MLKLDLHVHSNDSPDSISSWDAIFNRARERGLDGLAITDHDVFDRERFRTASRQTDLLLIPGEEITSSHGHIIGLFLEEKVEPGQDPETTIEAIHSQEGIAIAAHPYRLFDNYRSGFFNQFDAVESFNGRSGDPTVEGSPNYYADELAREFRYGVTGGSDSHVPWTVGQGYTVLDAQSNPDSVKECLLSGGGRAEGQPTAESNKIFSKVLYQWNRPSFEGFMKMWPQSIKFLAKDLRRSFLKS